MCSVQGQKTEQHTTKNLDGFIIEEAKQMVLIAGIDPGLQFATFAAIFRRAKISDTFHYFRLLPCKA